ncbi:MAG: hypothetical protein ACYS0G_14475 [Planctomycetota bacterium]|jgi:hypothetical protein
MSRSQLRSGRAAALWASAFVIAALTIVQAGRLPGPAAHGEVAASRADYALLTASSGRGGEVDPDELLYVIDNRDQVLMVYEIENAQRRQVLLRDGGPLENLFRRARP